MRKGIVRNKNAIAVLRTIAENPKITGSKLCQLLTPQRVKVPHLLAGLKDMELVKVELSTDWPKHKYLLAKEGRRVLDAVGHTRASDEAAA